MPDEKLVTICYKTTSNETLQGVDLVGVSVSAITVQEMTFFRVRD